MHTTNSRIAQFVVPYQHDRTSKPSVNTSKSIGLLLGILVVAFAGACGPTCDITLDGLSANEGAADDPTVDDQIPQSLTPESVSSACKSKCEAVGECGKRTYRAGDSGVRCYVRSSDDCAQSRACEDEGRCHLYDGIRPDHCVALTDLDCRASTECTADGKCSLGSFGECKTAFSACARTDACRDSGECNYKHGKGCVEGAAECKFSCISEGACELVDGVCVAGSEAGCRKSMGCAGEGQCALEGDRCVASDTGCAASSTCDLNSSCTAVPDGDTCYDGRTACGEMCWVRGDCDRIDGVCQPKTDAHCQASVGCTVTGRCAAQGHMCRATKDKHCEQSLECKAFGRCTRRGGVCQADGKSFTSSPCIRKPECAGDGRCLYGDDRSCQTAAQAGLPDWQPPPMVP